MIYIYIYIFVSNKLSDYEDASKLAAKIGARIPTNFSNLFASHMVWALKNNQFIFDKSCTNRINFQIPLPLFYSDELLQTSLRVSY